jgi:hypothetical protein
MFSHSGNRAPPVRDVAVTFVAFTRRPALKSLSALPCCGITASRASLSESAHDCAAQRLRYPVVTYAPYTSATRLTRAYRQGDTPPVVPRRLVRRTWMKLSCWRQGDHISNRVPHAARCITPCGDPSHDARQYGSPGDPPDLCYRAAR